MIDTHCHLDFPVFDPDREVILQQAKIVGFEGVVIPSVLQKDWQRVIDLCQKDNPITLYPALGLHPCFIAEHGSVTRVEVTLLEMLKKANNEVNRVVAVGEIGLDYFSDVASKEQQLALFEMQLQVAKNTDLPVLLHVRKAHDDVLKRLRKQRLSKGGIVHAFSGSEQQAEQYCELGFALGIGGSATYERAKKLARVIRKVPLESLVLETDAPDILPSFARGQRNSPLNLPRIASYVASIREIEVDALVKQTSANACRVLDLRA